ncbi:MAG TPA: oxidoreductase, partial [Mycobacterium sp.]|nr:oxidoreductase [Mycobacterium sp.]
MADDAGDRREVGRSGPGAASARTAVVNHREELKAAGDIVDRETWAGGLEDKRAIAPRVRVGRDKWLNLLWLIPIGFTALVAAVAVAKHLVGFSVVQDFMHRYPGTQVPAASTPGIPAWANWTHFFNL